MKTQIIEKTVYDFNDLQENQELKSKVLEKNWDINVDGEWHEYIIDDFKEIGKIIGFEVTETYFSGFSSQGDGACFEGYYKYRKNALKDLIAYAQKDNVLQGIAHQLQKLQKKCFYMANISITHYGHYYHENSMKYSFDSIEYGYESNVANLEDEFKDCFCDLAKWLYRYLESSYNYLTSENAIMEMIESNKYEFDINGNFN